MENRREHCQDIIARSLFSCLSEMDQRARERLRDAGLPETPLYRLRELRRIGQEEDRAIGCITPSSHLELTALLRTECTDERR